MTLDEIQEKIRYLRDDNQVCANIIKNPYASAAEKVECRARIKQNLHDLTHLETTLLLCKTDKLF